MDYFSIFFIYFSVAILRYLSRKYKDHVADHWYPCDIKGQARVDEYLEWQHTNTRINCAMYFRTKVVSMNVILTFKIYFCFFEHSNFN